MSGCNVCIGTNDYDCADFEHSEIRTARKLHMCCECRGEIAPGQRYEHRIMRYGGDFSKHKTCIVCVDIRDKFLCGNGFLIETLWDEIRDYVLPEMTTGCMDGLSAAAKQRLVDEWNKWKFGRKR